MYIPVHLPPSVVVVGGYLQVALLCMSVFPEKDVGVAQVAESSSLSSIVVETGCYTQTLGGG